MKSKIIIPKFLKWIYNTGQPTIIQQKPITVDSVKIHPMVQSVCSDVLAERKGIFSDIIGHNNVKTILTNMLDSVLKNNIPVSILLDGSAGCGKSLFLKSIEKQYPQITKYIDGSKATKAGIFDTLIEDENNSIKFLVIDEIDKLDLDDQESLLTLIEDGRIIQT